MSMTRLATTRNPKTHQPTPAREVAGKTAAQSLVINRFRSDFGLTQPPVVRLSGYSPRSVASWSKGVKATEPARRKFTEFCRLPDALNGLIGSPAEMAGWLLEPNSAFEGSPPLQVIERGESDRIWRMIYTLESGDPG